MSAVLVKMPPPALANSASELAPKLNAMMMSCVAGEQVQEARRPSSEEATTAMPMTAPPRKPAMNAGAMPFCAAETDLTLAMVAMLMPTTPAVPDSSVPNR